MAEDAPFDVDHPDPAVARHEILAAAHAARRETGVARRLTDPVQLVGLARKDNDARFKLAVARSLLAAGDADSSEADAAADLAVSALARPENFTGERRDALKAILAGPPGGWLRPAPGAPQNPLEWTREHLEVIDPAAWHAALGATPEELGVHPSALTTGPVDLLLPCDDGEPVVVGEPAFVCDFDTVAQRLDPAHWATYSPAMFSGSKVLKTAYALKAPAPSWRGALYERASLGITRLLNVLQIDYTVSGTPGSREARALYYLDTSLDGQVTADDGMLWAYETAPDQVVIVFTKRLAGLPMTSYCSRMTTFLEMGLNALKGVCAL